MENEAKYYKKDLKDAQKKLIRWRNLGRRFKKTSDPNWRRVLKIRQDEVKILRTLIKRTEA